MKSIFEEATRKELITRINQLRPVSKAVWGKMNVAQMLRHCSMSEEMFQGKSAYKRLLIGRLFGSSVLKGILAGGAPMKQNQPTHPLLKIRAHVDFESERNKWIGLLNNYEHFSNTSFVHPFFGAMSRDQVGAYVYKHTDHHLRQFGV